MTDEEDPSAFLVHLADGARRAAAGTDVTTERERGLGDRLLGRPGRTVALRLEGGERRLTLRRDGDAWQAEIARVSGGVAIARERVPLGVWLDAFAAEVALAAARAAGDAAAARRALAQLGLGGGPSTFTVDRDDVPRGLDALVADAAGRLPAEGEATLHRIVGLLREALPRATGDGGALVRRTATVYLPDTLRAYAALPPDWARTGSLRDGRSPDEALTEQLAALEEAARRMRDSALEDDADALLLNGLFLEQRFGP